MKNVQPLFDRDIDRSDTKSFALVTGASSGIGLAIAEELAGMNKNLVLVALPGTGLERIGRLLAEQFDIEVYTYTIDLTDPVAPYRILEACNKSEISINILVNNAGFGNLELFETSNLPELQQMLALNNGALISLTYLFIPLLKKSSPSYILNLGSLASFFKIPYKAVYSATKSFVYSFSAALRLELRRANISVSCLCPGSTLTSPRVRDILMRTSGKNPLFVQQPSAVAKTAIRKLFQKQFRIVPGVHNQVLLGMAALLPEFVTDKILLRVFKPTTNTSSPQLLQPGKALAGWSPLVMANR
jgi:uncharacterized protein